MDFGGFLVIPDVLTLLKGTIRSLNDSNMVKYVVCHFCSCNFIISSGNTHLLISPSTLWGVSVGCIGTT